MKRSFTDAHKPSFTPSFDKISSHADKRLRNIADQTATNLTKKDRTIRSYAELFDTDLLQVIRRTRETLQRNVRILDVGCGDTTAMRTLLSTVAGKHISKVYGISKDYFAAAQITLEQFPGKFRLFIGEAKDIFNQTNFNVDIIFDVWGPFSYSLKKMQILQAYYDNLLLGGKAYIYFGSAFEPVTHRKTQAVLVEEATARDGRTSLIRTNLRDALTSKYPLHFTKADADGLIMHKINPECPFTDEYDYQYSGIGFTIRAEASVSEIARGNGTTYTDVVITPVRLLPPKPVSKHGRHKLANG